MNNDSNLSAQAKKDFMRAAMFEAGCLATGVAAFFMTSNWIWIVIGLVAGLGFSLPVIIKLVRTKGETNHAPR